LKINDLYIGLAEILEIEYEECTRDFVLTAGAADWDSLAVISTIALIDELFNCTVSGQALEGCKTVGDIERLIESARAK
jgi:acyl carrier protein